MLQGVIRLQVLLFGGLCSCNKVNIRGLSQKFVDNMDNGANTRKKHINTTAILPMILTISIQNLNKISFLLMTLC